MSLIDLPLEIFQAVMTETVWLVGLRQAVHLRLISKLFDTEVQRAIYALPVFDDVDRHLLPAGILLPRRMSPSMTTRLILSKMDIKNSEKRPLCLAITRAVAYLENKFEQKEASSRRGFIESLAGAAARTLSLSNLADCLGTTPTIIHDGLQKVREFNSTHFPGEGPAIDPPKRPFEYLTSSLDVYTDSAPQDALIAALSTKRFQLAKQLLEGGVKVMTKSHAFGVPLQVAAAMGAQELVRTSLDGLLVQGDVDTSYIIDSARRFVLEGAATGGHETIVRMILDDLENVQGREFKEFARPIMIAVKNGHEDVALLLSQRYNPLVLRTPSLNGRIYLNLRESRFWRRLSRAAARYGCENILRIALETIEGSNRNENRAQVGCPETRSSKPNVEEKIG